MKETTKEKAELKKLLSNKKWRLNNLYRIIDKQGAEIQFKMNWAQKELIDNLWYLNIILKARQLGMSTFICLFFLDICLFNSNKSAGIICDSLSNAKAFLRDKIKFAYDKLPKIIKDELKIERYSFSADDAGIWFSNGSSIQVGTSFRSGTLQYLHISEHAKICKKYPEKAREIRTGALNTVQAGQMIFIESTSEGEEGDFYDFVQKAESLSLEGTEMSKLDFKLSFFPWYKQKEYELDKPQSFIFSTESKKYFSKLKSESIELTEQKKFWYVKKKELLSDDIKKEYPSTSKESFESNTEGRYFGVQIMKIKKEKRVCEFDVEQGILVNTYWDLGIDDYMSIWFAQIFGKEIRLIDYLEGSGEGIGYYIQELKKKPYEYGKHYAPHDIKVRELSDGQSRWKRAKEMGINFEIVPKLSFEDGIDSARATLGKCWFKKSTTNIGFAHLQNYQKKWNESLGRYTGEQHDQHSHAAAAFRYLSVSQKELNPPEISQQELLRLKENSLKW